MKAAVEDSETAEYVSVEYDTLQSTGSQSYQCLRERGDCPFRAEVSASK